MVGRGLAGSTGKGQGMDVGVRQSRALIPATSQASYASESQMPEIMESLPLGP